MGFEAGAYAAEEILGGSAVGAGTAEMAGTDIAVGMGGLGAVGAAAPEITAETVGALGASAAADVAAGGAEAVAPAMATADTLTVANAGAPTLDAATASVPTTIADPSVDVVSGDYGSYGSATTSASTANTSDVAATSTDAAATDGGTQMRDVKPAVEGNANVISTPQVPPTVPPTSSVWQTIGATPFQAGALGLGIYGQYKAAEERKSVQEQLNRQAQLTRPAAESLMSQYQSGTIGPAQEKQISDYTSQQKAQIKQRYAKMGRDPNYDSAAQQEMANVDVQAASMRDTALQNVLKSGLAAAGVTAGPYQQAVMAGYQSDTASQTAQANFLYQLAQMQAKQGSGAPTTPAAPAEA